MKNIRCNLLLILSILVFQSCLKEEENIFDKSSAQRMIEAAKEYEEILSSAENGWIMNYYAGYDDNKVGGYPILCAFDKGEVTMAGAFTLSGKYTTAGKKISSSYSFIDSQGPVLSFNGYNDVLHGFADPGNALDPDGYAGDIEFVIVKATKNEIVMKGLKRKLRIVMYPMEAGKDWDEYCRESLAMVNTLSNITRFSVEKAGNNIGYLTFWPSDKNVYNTETPKMEAVKYTVTDKGVNLYDSLNINGVSINRLVWNSANSTFTDYYGAQDVEIKPIIMPYQNFVGTYDVTATNMNDPIRVTVSALEGGKKFRVSRELIGYEFDIDFLGNNKLVIKPQLLAVDAETGHYIKLRVAESSSLLGIINMGTSFGGSNGYGGSWYKGTIQNPELRFLKTDHSSGFTVTYALGFRVIEYNKDSTAADDIVEYKTLMMSNLIFVRR